MPDHVRIMPGASVEATDGRFGVVKEIVVQPSTGQLSYLAVQHDGRTVSLPASLIAEVVSPVEVRLGLTREAARTRISGSVIHDGDHTQIRVPIHEERLRVETRPIDLGELRLHKVVETVEQAIQAAVERDDLDVQRTRVDRPIEAPMEARYEDGWLVVPVMEEVLVVRKQLVLAEEIRIRTRRVTEQRTVAAEVRRERIDVEDARLADARGQVSADHVHGPRGVTDRPAAEVGH